MLSFITSLDRKNFSKITYVFNSLKKRQYNGINLTFAHTLVFSFARRKNLTKVPLFLIPAPIKYSVT